MLAIPRRYSHFVYGTMQSGLTCAIAAAVANYPLLHSGHVMVHWLQSWLFSWLIVLPVVLFAAPIIHRVAFAVNSEG
jgi:hypothetical protein